MEREDLRKTLSKPSPICKAKDRFKREEYRKNHNFSYPPPPPHIERYLEDQFPRSSVEKAYFRPANDSFPKNLDAAWTTTTMTTTNSAAAAASTTTTAPMAFPFTEGNEDEYDHDFHDRNYSFKNGVTTVKRPHMKTTSNRLLNKSGSHNIRYRNISRRNRRFFSDFYTTLIDSNWTYTLLIFALSFYIMWTTFAAMYFFIAWIHQDLDPINLKNETRTPCIWQMSDFASAFLFSLETQHTIGYGTRQTTNECPDAIILMSIQSVLGCLVQAFMVGLVFAKLSRPKNRAKTVDFSKIAVICERDNKLCLLFRIADMRHESFIVGAQISLKMFRRRITAQGEMFHEIVPLNIKPNSCEESCLFLIWPITVCHVIDEDSPFYRKTARDLAMDKFELNVTLEGTIESTSMTFQARTSYTPEEIYWGHRFEPIVIFRSDHEQYQVNFAAFNSTYEVETPKCSAFELEDYYSRSRSIQYDPRNGKWALRKPNFQRSLLKDDIESPNNHHSSKGREEELESRSSSQTTSAVVEHPKFSISNENVNEI